ncbi:hypothetical protein [Thalassococcus sp. S3]|uniref:hypothetical protein n=1 Tax=Thalassococcus sp. S3 TaxID=2017482 RepID=UPI0010241359|nr:hypothetical protein [Thalassococcus sp. S3]QBF30607.1 hypothetical protein CFI11_05180 [Thalassococcus sp. S3]
MRIKALAAALFCASAIGAGAEMPVGPKTIALVDGEGARVEVGDILFAPDGGYRIDWREAPFKDHFLSMRPFRCLEGAHKHWCHVPYPYAINRAVSPDDLTDLEYDLLFLWKGATEYGINMWNGVYYRLTLENGQITGALHEMDMDALSAPPDTGNLRPLSEDDLHEAEADSHWLPYVVID